MPAPGTKGAFTFNIDSFIMFEQKDRRRQEAQGHLASAIMEPQFQEVFNLNKGSIPVRTGHGPWPSSTSAPRIRPRSSSRIAKASKLVPSWAHEMAMPLGNRAQCSTS